MKIVRNYSVLLIVLFTSVESLLAQNCNFELLSESTPVCAGTMNDFIAEFNTVTGNVVDTTFSWSINDTVVSNLISFDTVLENRTNGNLDFKINFKGESLQGGCSIDSTYYLTIHPQPSIETTILNPLCPNTGTSDFATIYVNSNLQISSLHYSDITASSFSTSDYNDSISYVQAGSYYVFLKGPGPLFCKSDTIQVEIEDPEPFSGPTGILTQGDNCSQNTGAIVMLGLSGGTRPYSFINTNTNLPYNTALNDSVIAGLTGGNNYLVHLTDAHGCPWYFSTSGEYISIDTNSIPPQPIYENNYSVCFGDSLLLVDQEEENSDLKHYYIFDTYFITSSDGTTYLSSTYLQEEESVSIRSQGALGSPNAGCYSEPFIVEIEQVLCEEDSTNSEDITNAFSPNSSIIENATFKINLSYVNDQVVTDVEVTIYNRWGDVIREFENYDNTTQVWHGDNQNGDEMPEGTYFYTVEVASKNFATSGWVYLNK